MSTTIRTRWAAIGAAVAITLGGGGIGLVSATQPDGASTLIPITPCRVIDTRPDFNVGPKASPLGPGETHTVAAHGDNGDCTGIPTDAVALSMNVTAVDASAPTFLTIWATGDTQPTASSLNPTPGQPPAPNAVTTELSAGGEFDIFNLAGNVHVLADINGYYVDHHHDDRYYTQDEIDAVLPFAETAERTAFEEITGSLEPMVTVQVTAPTAGQVTINSAANVFHNTAGGDVVCFILRSTDADPSLGTNILGAQWFESEGPSSNDGSIAGTRLFDVAAGSTTIFELRCAENDGDGGRLGSAILTAIFTPSNT